MARYDVKQQADGSWAVFEDQGSAPLAINGIAQHALSRRAAELAASSLPSARFGSACFETAFVRMPLPSLRTMDRSPRVARG
jgi:hypothetical protein